VLPEINGMGLHGAPHDQKIIVSSRFTFRTMSLPVGTARLAGCFFDKDTLRMFDCQDV